MGTQGSAAELEARRVLAADLLQDGNTPAEVAQMLGVSVSSTKRWKQAFLRDGLAGVAAKPHPGPRPKLSEKQREQLCDLLVEGAQAAGYRADLWTCRRVGQLIRERFGVSYHFNHVGRLLHVLGFSPQQPKRRARERDEEAIRQWREQDWPRIKKGVSPRLKPATYRRVKTSQLE